MRTIIRIMQAGIVISTLSLLAVNSAWAQAQTTSSGVDASKFSVSTGIGFYAGDNDAPSGVDGEDGFLLNFEGTYHIDENWSAGVDFQFGFDDDFLLFSMPFYGQYDFANVPGEIPILSDMHPFARLGIGFTYAEIDTRFGDDDDTGFLFVIGGGMAYPINDHVSLESRMQFNITTNDAFADDFYFSWELISLRYRF